MALEHDIFYSLRVGLISLLYDNVVLDGETLPVYGNTNSVGGDKYILIQNINSGDRSAKTLRNTLTAMQISIFCKGDDLAGNEHEDIGAQVLHIIEPYNGFKIPINQNFEIIKQDVVMDKPMSVFSRDTTQKILERHIVIEFEIQHLLRA